MQNSRIHTALQSAFQKDLTNEALVLAEKTIEDIIEDRDLSQDYPPNEDVLLTLRQADPRMLGYVARLLAGINGEDLMINCLIVAVSMNNETIDMARRQLLRSYPYLPPNLVLWLSLVRDCTMINGATRCFGPRSNCWHRSSFPKKCLATRMAEKSEVDTTKQNLADQPTTSTSVPVPPSASPSPCASPSASSSTSASGSGSASTSDYDGSMPDTHVSTPTRSLLDSSALLQIGCRDEHANFIVSLTGVLEIFSADTLQTATHTTRNSIVFSVKLTSALAQDDTDADRVAKTMLWNLDTLVNDPTRTFKPHEPISFLQELANPANWPIIGLPNGHQPHVIVHEDWDDEENRLEYNHVGTYSKHMRQIHKRHKVPFAKIRKTWRVNRNFPWRRMDNIRYNRSRPVMSARPSPQ